MKVAMQSEKKMSSKKRNSKIGKEKLSGKQRGQRKRGVNLTRISFWSEKSEWPECKKLIMGTCPAFLLVSLWHCQAEVCGSLGSVVHTKEQGKRALHRGPLAGLAAWNTVQLASPCVLPAYNYQCSP